MALTSRWVKVPHVRLTAAVTPSTTTGLVPVSEQLPSKSRRPDAVALRPAEPFAKLPPVPVSETLVESRRKLWHLLGRAQAQKQFQPEGAEDGEDRIFGSKELGKTLVLAADLGAEKQLQQDAWKNTLDEMFYLAKVGELDNVALFMAAQSLYRLRHTEFSASCHPGSLRLFALVLDTALQRTSTASMRHLANVASWLARSVQLVEGHPALRQQIVVLSMRAAEELLVRQHSGSAVSGREVGAICDAVRVLGLRNELFLTYLRRLLRKDWDMIWTPKALIDAAWCWLKLDLGAFASMATAFTGSGRQKYYEFLKSMESSTGLDTLDGNPKLEKSKGNEYRALLQHCGTPMGLMVADVKPLMQALVIIAVDESQALRKWNGENPQLQIKVGHAILEVNGVNDPNGMRIELSKAETLDLLLKDRLTRPERRHFEDSMQKLRKQQ
eukprot:symbB.v1.2.000462.t1/scaffold11.1/size528188/11